MTMCAATDVQQALRRELHHGRFLSIKYLPRQVSEADVRELLSDVDVSSVHLMPSANGASSAQVQLSAPEEVLDSWDADRVFMLRGQRVPVTPSPLTLLCVANLAPGLAEHQLRATLEAFGPLLRCFMMRCAATSVPKGYAVAEFALQEHCLRARQALAERSVTCDLLEPGLQTLEALHSKCMLIEELPENFRDLSRLRQIFSAVTPPPYCQLCLTGPRPWGLVEFHTWQDAEATWLAVDGSVLNGRKLRVSFCLPGVRAINLFLRRQEEARSSGGLLPDPPSPLVYRQLQNLAKQNPVFAKNLEAIVLTEQTKKPLPKAVLAPLHNMPFVTRPPLMVSLAPVVDPAPWPPSVPLTPQPDSPQTPQGQKRKLNHIPPSPEPSPESNYIEKYLRMPLEEKRKHYRKEHVTLENLLTWPQFAEKESLTTKDEPKAQIDDEINSKVSLFEGDITTLEIDAIVNAANSSLFRGAGVCGAIFAAAGDILEDECDSLDGCPAGQAKLTGGYRLPAKYILHAVGPKNKDHDVLKRCYNSCLQHLLPTEDQPNIKSIAFPCISTGIYGFPNDSAAEIAIATSRKFLEQNKDQVDRIVFCLFDKIDKKFYKKFMQIYFPLKSSNAASD